MRKILLTLAMSFSTVVSFGPSVMAAQPAPTPSPDEQLCTANPGYTYDNGVCTPPGGKTLTGSDSYLTNIINLLMFVAGAIAVIVIIIGGIRYITSTGDAMRIKQAKDTILYGIVGLIIAILAYAIVNSLVLALK